MDRSLVKRDENGVTLLELLIAITLFTVLLLAASNLMISFGRISSNFIRNEASLMGTALGAFEDIVGKITISNLVTIPATTVVPNPVKVPPDNSIEIRVAPAGAATSDHLNDTIHYYWQNGSQLMYKSKIGVLAASADSVIAGDIVTVSFTPVAGSTNQVDVQIVTKPTEGPRETLRTIAVARSRSAQ